MKTKKTKAYGSRGIWIAVLFLVAAVSLLTVLRLHFIPRGTEGEKHITITVTDQDGSSKSYPVDTDAAYLKEAAETVLSIQGEKTGNGYTIYTINGVTADYRKGNVYWAIYVNGKYGNYAVDQQPVTDGDTYAFVYESY